MNKKLLSVALIAGILSLSSIAVSRVYAYDNQHFRSSIIQKIATKFNLKESEIQAIFDEERQAKRVEMNQIFVSKLDQLIKDGKINQTQKDLILKKHDEIESRRISDRTAFDSKSPEKRREMMLKDRQEIDDWAKANGIDKNYLFFMGGPKERGPGLHR